MGAHLITFLGPNNYVPLRYRLRREDNETEEYTPFVARAVSKLLDCNHVTVLATETAWAKNGEALSNALEQAGRRWQRETIPDGEAPHEQRQQFRILLRQLQQAAEQAERVVLDITLGWRAQSFFASTAIVALMAAERLPEQISIVYGAAPPKPQDGDVAPIWDLSHYLLMLQIALGLAIFKATGNAAQLLQALRQENSRACRMAVAAGEDAAQRNTTSLIRALEKFHAHFAELRVPHMTIGTAAESPSSQTLLQKLEEYAQRCEREHPALVPLLDEIHAMLQPLPCTSLATPEGHAALAHLARLYLERHQLAEAANVAREGLICLYATGPEATDAGHETYDESARQQAEEAFRNDQSNRGWADIRNDLEHCGFRSSPAGALNKAVGKLVSEFSRRVEKGKAKEGGPSTPDKKEKHESLFLRASQGGRVLFVSRHAGAQEWARRQGLGAVEVVTHLQVEQICPGDVVVGTLPIHIAAEVIARGARYWHLRLDVPPEARGRELTADDMERYGARLEEYVVSLRDAD